MTHDAPMAVGGPEIGVLRQELRDLCLDGLGQQRARSVAQNLGELVIERLWLNQLDNAIVGQGISLLQWRVEASNTPTICRLHQFTPSPTLGHSSLHSRQPFARCKATDAAQGGSQVVKSANTQVACRLQLDFIRMAVPPQNSVPDVDADQFSTANEGQIPVRLQNLTHLGHAAGIFKVRIKTVKVERSQSVNCPVLARLLNLLSMNRNVIRRDRFGMQSPNSGYQLP